MALTQKQRNTLVTGVVDLLNDSKPKTDIFDCLDILANLQEAFIKQLEHNINNTDGGSQ